MIEQSEAWAISPLAVTRLSKLEQQLLTERAANPQIKAYADVTAGPAAEAERADLPITVRDNIAIIPLRGIMLKSYPWPSDYVTSTAHVRAAVRAARLDESIQHIIILSDTPGGDVRGMHELGDEITAAAQDKNVIVQVEGTLASAGYHVAVGAKAIYASHRMNTIGSIGVRTALHDSSKLYENAGITVHKVDTGEHKSTGLEGVPITEEQLAEVKRVIEQLYQEFLAVIIKGRGISEKELKPLADGRTWFASEALQYKLIDGIQPLSQTLQDITKQNQPAPKPRLTRAQAAEMFAKYQ